VWGRYGLRRVIIVILVMLFLLPFSAKTVHAQTLEASVIIGASGSINWDSQSTSVTFVVALDGSGDFTDIQSAIDAVPPTATGTIIIKSGTYDLNPNYNYPTNR